MGGTTYGLSHLGWGSIDVNLKYSSAEETFETAYYNGGNAVSSGNLGGLKGMVKNAGKCRGYVGTRGFKSFGKEFIRASSLIGVEGFKGSLRFRFRDVGICHAYVCWCKVGMDPLSLR